MAEISDDQNAAVKLAKQLLAGKPVPSSFAAGGSVEEAKKRFLAGSVVRDYSSKTSSRDDRHNDEFPPLPVYHGTVHNFDSFRPSGQGTTTMMGIPVQHDRHGIFFSEDESFAHGFTGDKKQGKVGKYHLAVKNPLYVHDDGYVHPKDQANLIAQGVDRNWVENHLGGRNTWEAFDGEHGAFFTDALKKAGYDGITFPEENHETGESSRTWVALHPNQVKSTDSAGFDPNDDRFAFSRGGRLDLERAAKARADLPPSGLPRSRFMPGVPRAVHADGGKVADSENFKKWFAGSKIAHPDGRPVTLYHGSNKDIRSFKIGDGRNGSALGEGIYFTADPEYASGYTKMSPVERLTRKIPRDQDYMEGANVTPVHVSIKNPLVWDASMPTGKDLTSYAKAKGHDGIVYHTGTKFYEVAAFDPKQVKSATANSGAYGDNEDITKASGGPVLRSKAAEIAAALPQASGTVEQMLAMLKKRGVKPAELDNAGAPVAPSGKITRDELAAHFRARQPTVIHAISDNSDGPDDERKYSQYIAPGKVQTSELAGDVPSSYREHRLIMTDREPPEIRALQKRRDDMREDMREAIRGNDQDRFSDLQAEDKAIPAMIGAHQRGRLEERYKSSHWEDPNVLAHFRTTDRPGGHLNVEEIQSDWGQEGRKRGFRPAGSKAAAIVGDQELREKFQEASNRWAQAEDDHKRAHSAAYGVTDRLLKENPDAEFEEINSHPDMLKALEEEGEHRAKADHWREQAKSLQAQMNDDPHAAAINDKRPPTAPYVTNTGSWVDLALKHVFHEAAKGGYDHVSFNPGEANAKMFGISKQIKALSYHPDKNELNYLPDAGMRSQWERKEDISRDKLPEYVGQEVADRLLATERSPKGLHYLDQQNLDIGGAGMKSFYNDIIPKAALKLARQHDPEIQPNPQGFSPTGGFSLPVTESLRTGVLQNGFGAFKDGGKVSDDLFDYSRLDEVPKVAQTDLPRYEPPRGVSQRTLDVTSNPDVRDKMHEVLEAGEKLGGKRWYNADPLRDKFMDVLGSGGEKAFRKYMDLVAATSPRSEVGTNVRNASYYYHRHMLGHGVPEVGDKNPQPYGHMAQKLHQMNAKKVVGEGWDPLQNPKPASFVENLTGNQRPGTIDTHAFRLPAIIAKDPRFLDTAYQTSKDAPKRNMQKEVESGSLGIDDVPAAAWQSLPKDNEYRHFEHYYRDLGRERGMTTAQTQASAWVGGGALTGLGSDESKPFLRFLEDRVHLTAKKHNMEPRDVLHKFIKGEIPLLSTGGFVRGRAAGGRVPGPGSWRLRDGRGPNGEKVLHVDLGGAPEIAKRSNHWTDKALGALKG